MCRMRSNSFIFVTLPRIASAPTRLRARTDRRAFGGGRAQFYLDVTHPALGLGTDQIDVQQPTVQQRATDFDPFGEHKRPLELARRDAAVQVDTLRIVSLSAAHHQLIVLDRDAEVAHLKARDGEGDSQRVLAKLLDIVGRISVCRYLADSIERPLEMVE